MNRVHSRTFTENLHKGLSVYKRKEASLVITNLRHLLEDWGYSSASQVLAAYTEPSV